MKLAPNTQVVFAARTRICQFHQYQPRFHHLIYRFLATYCFKKMTARLDPFLLPLSSRSNHCVTLPEERTQSHSTGLASGIERPLSRPGQLVSASQILKNYHPEFPVWTIYDKTHRLFLHETSRRYQPAGRAVQAVSSSWYTSIAPPSVKSLFMPTSCLSLPDTYLL